ncbi:hypothetical protein ACFLVS_04980 [Chloroflexota bacterium]
MFPSVLFHVLLLLAIFIILGAELALNQLSKFRGPPHTPGLIWEIQVKGRRRNLHWVDLTMAELELEKLILYFAQSNKATGKSPMTMT